MLRIRFVGLLVASTAFVHGGEAATLEFPIQSIVSSSGTPGGATPWLTAQLDDEESAGTVQLTFEATGLAPGEFVSKLFFNLDPALDPADLTFSAAAASGGNGFAMPTIDVGVDAFTGGGGGRYDLSFSFTTSNAGGGAMRFGPGEQYVVTIGGIASLVASSFDVLSSPQGGNGVHRTLAHIQGITGGASAWVSAPEPSGIVAAALSLLAASCFARPRQRA